MNNQLHKSGAQRNTLSGIGESMLPVPNNKRFALWQAVTTNENGIALAWTAINDYLVLGINPQTQNLPDAGHGASFTRTISGQIYQDNGERFIWTGRKTTIKGTLQYSSVGGNLVTQALTGIQVTAANRATLFMPSTAGLAVGASVNVAGASVPSCAAVTKTPDPPVTGYQGTGANTATVFTTDTAGLIPGIPGGVELINLFAAAGPLADVFATIVSVNPGVSISVAATSQVIGVTAVTPSAVPLTVQIVQAAFVGDTQVNGIGWVIQSINAGVSIVISGAGWSITAGEITDALASVSQVASGAGCNFFQGITDTLNGDPTNFDAGFAPANSIMVGMQKTQGAVAGALVLLVNIAGTPVLYPTPIVLIEGERYAWEIVIQNGTATLIVNQQRGAIAPTIPVAAMALDWWMDTRSITSLANSSCTSEFLYAENDTP